MKLEIWCWWTVRLLAVVDAAMAVAVGAVVGESVEEGKQGAMTNAEEALINALLRALSEANESNDGTEGDLTVEERLPDALFLGTAASTATITFPPDANISLSAATSVTNSSSAATPVLLQKVRLLRAAGGRRGGWRLRMAVPDAALRAVPLRLERRELRLRAECGPLRAPEGARAVQNGEVDLMLRDATAAGVLFLDAGGGPRVRAAALELSLRAAGSAQLEVSTSRGRHRFRARALSHSPAAAFLPAAWTRVRRSLLRRFDAALEDAGADLAQEIPATVSLTETVGRVADAVIQKAVAAMQEQGGGGGVFKGPKGDDMWWSGPESLHRAGEVLLAPYDGEFEDYAAPLEEQFALLARCPLLARGLRMGRGAAAGEGTTLMEADAEFTLLAALNPLTCAGRLLVLRSEDVTEPVRLLTPTADSEQSLLDSLFRLIVLPRAAKAAARAVADPLKALPCKDLQSISTLHSPADT